MRAVLLGGLLLLAASPVALAATSPCTETQELTPPAWVELSARPARLCGVAFFATAANGYCHVFDSPDPDDPTHGQARTVAEPGAATAGNSAAVGFGDNGYPTRFGLGAYAVNGRCIVYFGTTP